MKTNARTFRGCGESSMASSSASLASSASSDADLESPRCRVKMQFTMVLGKSGGGGTKRRRTSGRQGAGARGLRLRGNSRLTTRPGEKSDTKSIDSRIYIPLDNARRDWPPSFHELRSFLLLRHRGTCWRVAASKRGEDYTGKVLITSSASLSVDTFRIRKSRRRGLLSFAGDVDLSPRLCRGRREPVVRTPSPTQPNRPPLSIRKIRDSESGRASHRLKWNRAASFVYTRYIYILIPRFTRRASLQYFTTRYRDFIARRWIAPGVCGYIRRVVVPKIARALGAWIFQLLSVQRFAGKLLLRRENSFFRFDISFCLTWLCVSIRRLNFTLNIMFRYVHVVCSR